jgi:hypothetical protein
MYNFSDGPGSLEEGCRTFSHQKNYRLLPPQVKNTTDSYRVILNYKDANLMPYILSCVSPYRFRGGWRKGNMEKYGVPLWPGRCGSCYKCAVEYLHMVAFGKLKLNSKFAQHCWDVLYKTGARISGDPRKSFTRNEAAEYFFDDSIAGKLP